SITFLPSLLRLLAPPGEAEDVGFAALAPVDRFLARNRGRVLALAAVAGIVSLAAAAHLRFDSHPLDLRRPKVESVSTLFDLMKNPETSPNTIDVPTPSLAAADALAAEIGQGTLVAQVVTLSSFVPADQDAKLAHIADANNLLDATLNPFE